MSEWSPKTSPWRESRDDLRHRRAVGFTVAFGALGALASLDQLWGTATGRVLLIGVASVLLIAHYGTVISAVGRPFRFIRFRGGIAVISLLAGHALATGIFTTMVVCGGSPFAAAAAPPASAVAARPAAAPQQGCTAKLTIPIKSLSAGTLNASLEVSPASGSEPSSRNDPPATSTGAGDPEATVAESPSGPAAARPAPPPRTVQHRVATDGAMSGGLVVPDQSPTDATRSEVATTVPAPPQEPAASHKTLAGSGEPAQTGGTLPLEGGAGGAPAPQGPSTPAANPSQPR